MKEIKFKTAENAARKFNKHTIVGNITKIPKALMLAGVMAVTAASPETSFAHGNTSFAYDSKVDAPVTRMQSANPAVESPAAESYTISSLAPIVDYVQNQSGNDNVFEQVEFFRSVEKSLSDNPSSKTETSFSKIPLLGGFLSSFSHANIMRTIQQLYNDLGEDEHARNIDNPFSVNPIDIVTKSTKSVAMFPDAFSSDVGKNILAGISDSHDPESIKGGVMFLADDRYHEHKLFTDLFGPDEKENIQMFIALHEMAHLSDHTAVHRMANQMDLIPGTTAHKASTTMPESDYKELRRNVLTSLETEADTTAILAMIKLKNMSKHEATQLTKNLLSIRAKRSLYETTPIHLGLNDHVILIDLIDNHFSDIKKMDMGSIPTLSHFIHEFSSTHPLPNRVREVLNESYGSPTDVNDYMEEEYRNNPGALNLPVDSIPAHHSISEALNQTIFGHSRSALERTIDHNTELFNNPSTQP